LAPEISLPEGTTVTPSSGTEMDFSDGSVIYKTEAKNGASREYTVTLGAFGVPQIMSFSIAGVPGIIDEENGTITVTVGSQENLRNLTPIFVITEGTTVDKASGVAQDFSSPVTYTVLSNDGFTGKQYTVTVDQIAPPLMTSLTTGEDVCSVTGIINNEAETVEMIFPAGANLTAITPTIEVSEGSTISPDSGVEQDFSGGSVNYTITNAEGLTKTYAVSARTVDSTNEIIFIGAEECVNALVDDDAKAAAEYLQATYPDQFSYVQFSNVSASSLSSAKVVMLYYLTPLEDVGFSATSSDVSTMLPSELQSGTSQTTALTNYVKAGGNMLIAGDPTPFIFNLGRVPADFSQPRGPGNYTYSEFACAGSSGCVDTGKPANDIWGLGMRASNNSTDRQGHPIFNGLTFTNGEFLALNNAATREARLIWWQQFDGVLNPSCCGQDGALLFEQTFSAIKFGTLANYVDAFGYGAVMWNPTNGSNDANFDPQIPTDFQGTIFTLENTLIGYEWGSNGTTNDYQGNIETFTKNIVDYLYGL
jgi:hypothetical protein